MGHKSRFIWTGAALFVLGSAVALAQSAPDPTAPEPSLSVQTGPSGEDNIAPAPANVQPSPANVEDAPIEVPDSARSDWAPDLNLEALPQDVAPAPSRGFRPSRPRKILNDAGENPMGNNSWNPSGSGNDSAVVARTNRRERPIDPIKRSELTKLSRIMGALHALRVSCAGRDDQTYRSRMATLLDLEAPSNGVLRDPLVDAFNGGFQAYGRGASACASDARAQEAALAKDGLQVARILSARYRPPPPVPTQLPPATQPRVNVAPAPNPPPSKPTR
jgi:uncharacterized protein (TIGR02301 family)